MRYIRGKRNRYKNMWYRIILDTKPPFDILLKIYKFKYFFQIGVSELISRAEKFTEEWLSINITLAHTEARRIIDERTIPKNVKTILNSDMLELGSQIGVK